MNQGASATGNDKWWRKPWNIVWPIIRAGIIPTGMLVFWWNYGGQEFTERKIREYTYDKLSDQYVREVVTLAATTNAAAVASNVATKTAESIARVVASSNAQRIALEYATKTAQQVAGDVARSNTQSFVENELLQLKRLTDSRIAEMSNAQVRAEQIQRVQDLLVRAKGGSFAAYQELKALNTNALTKESASAAALEVGFFFENWVRSDVTYGSGRANDSTPADGLVAAILNAERPDDRMIAAYHLGRLAKKNTAETLVKMIAAETNLYALSQALNSLEKVTGHSFRFFDMRAATNWWSTNMNEPSFHSPYEGFLRFPFSRILLDFKLNPHEVVEWMTKTTDLEPDASTARLLRRITTAQWVTLRELRQSLPKPKRGRPILPTFTSTRRFTSRPAQTLSER